MLAIHSAFGLTTFAANILTMLAIAAGTDYGIFIFGRYQEARGMPVRIGRRLLHHVQIRRSGHRGLGSDHRRRDVLPELRPAALLRHHGRAGGDRHDRGRGLAGHPGTGRAVPGQPDRAVRDPSGRPRAGSGGGSAPR